MAKNLKAQLAIIKAKLAKPNTKVVYGGYWCMRFSARVAASSGFVHWCRVNNHQMGLASGNWANPSKNKG